MKKILKNKTLIFYLLAFILPTAIIGILLSMKGIWWGSETSILASDSFHQYVIFNQTLRNALHGDGSLFYTFTSGAGLNFYALSSYYLGSFLSPLSFFFELKSMPDFIYLITLVKFGLIGLSTSYSLSNIYNKLHSCLVLLLSTSFSLMSFTTSQLEINIWLDVFILLPLILLGLDRLVKKKGKVLYFISLTILFIQNYYFGYMTAIFLTLWFMVQVSWAFKERIKRLLDFALVSLLAGGASMIMLLPTYLDLKTHGETFTKIVNLKTENSWYLDLFAKQLIGNYDTTKFGAIPMIFVGLFPLLAAIFFFTFKSIKWQVKSAYFILLSFIIASFYLQPLDLFWQGMHAPNMFLHRYAWVFSLVLIYMAAETFTRFNEITRMTYWIPFLFLGIGFGLTYYFRSHYDFLDSIHFIYTAEFLFAYFLLLTGFFFKKITSHLFYLSTLLFVVFEIALHSHYQIEGLAEEWNFPARSSYEYQLTDIDSHVKYAKKEEKHFFRMERLDPQTGNDSMKYNYNGISQFSSIRNRSSSSTLDKLGFRSDGTNLNLRYQNNTLIGDSLLAIAYNFTDVDPSKFGFHLVKEGNDVSLYKNSYHSQLGILTNGVYKNVKFTNLTLDNQTNFLNQLSGFDLQYYHSLNPNQVLQATTIDNRVTINAAENEETARVHYFIEVPYSTQLYVSLPQLTFSNEDSESVHITVNGLTNRFTLDNAFAFFNAGYFEEAQTVEVIISFPNNKQVSYDTPSFYRLDTDAFQIAMDEINSRDITVKSHKNKVIAHYSSPKKSSILFTLPFDKGWTATVNNKPTSIKRAQNGFMVVTVPKGTGSVQLTFIPKGLKLGIVLFLISCSLFFIYHKKTREI